MSARRYLPCNRCGAADGFIYAGLLLCAFCRTVLNRDERKEWTA